MKTSNPSVKHALFLFLFHFSIQSQAQQVSLKYSNQISPDSIKSYLQVLASDSLEGRETGRLGQKKAEAFLISKYKSWNLKPAGSERLNLNRDEMLYEKQFFQDHPINIRTNGSKNLVVGDTSFLFCRDF